MNSIQAQINLMATLLRKDPILLEFVKKSDVSMGGTKGYAPRQPLEALGEKKFLALGVLTDQYRVQSKDGVIHSLDPERRISLAAGMLTAETIFIEDPVLRLLDEMSIKVRESYVEAEHKPTPKRLPFRESWISTTRLLSHDQSTYMDGMLLIEELGAPNERWSFQLFGEAIIFGAPDQGFTDSLCMFLEEKVAVVETVQPSRQLRKESERLGLKAVNSVSVIRLRSFDYKASDASESRDCEYHHQWLVRGHIRNQWMASRQCHELRWIDPYMKGPEGAPIKERVFDLVR